jgi:hypothetical protein
MIHDFRMDMAPVSTEDDADARGQDARPHYDSEWSAAIRFSIGGCE